MDRPIPNSRHSTRSFHHSKNVAISKHFYHAAPAGRHGTALCKAACTTGAGTLYGQGDAVWPGRHALPPAASFLPPPGRPCPFPGREDMRKNTPRRSLRIAGHALSPPLRRARMVRASQTGALIRIRTPPGNATGAGAYLPAPPFCGIGKSPNRSRAQTRQGVPMLECTTVLKIAPSSCCWPASRWPSSDAAPLLRCHLLGASSSPCLHPVYDALQRRSMGRNLAALTCVILSLVLIIVPCAYILYVHQRGGQSLRPA